MADAVVDSPDRTGSPPDRTGSPLDDATRQRLLATVERELARASDAALAGGMSPLELAAQLERRIARLRAQAADLPVEDR